MSDTAIRELEPKEVWGNFAAINAIPRASKKEERIIEFMVDFGNKLDLETIVDPVGDVVIRKPASVGMENRKTIVMQSHLDMVHQKNADSDFDFDKEGIKMLIDGDWVKASSSTPPSSACTRRSVTAPGSAHQSLASTTTTSQPKS